MYKEPFYLDGRMGNNAFSYDERGEKPRLFVPSLIEGELDDVRIGSEVVFEDLDEQGVLQSCAGLKNFVCAHFEGSEVVIVDNHNHVLFFWYEAMSRGLIEPGATLIHVDQHKDMREPEEMLESSELEEVFRYTNEVVNVGNYIVPAMKQGLVGDVQLVTSEMALEDESFMDEDNKILNIDLDFFAPELSYVNFENAKAFIRKHAKTSPLITIATSPFFIEQELALQKMHQLLDK